MNKNNLTGLPLLLITAHLYTGVSAYATEVIYLTVGDHATLKCANVQYTNCSSTAWIYESSELETFELVTLGKVKERRTAKRLSVTSTCSLHISNLHAKDAGLYTCRQYLKNDGPQYGADAPVLLSILNMSELNPGSTVTLHCVLSTDAFFVQCYEHSARKLNLSWKAEEGTELVNPRYQVKHVSPCYTTLTVTLQQTDNNRKWICQLTVDSEMKTSHSYTTILSGNPGGKGTTTVSTTSPPNSPSATGNPGGKGTTTVSTTSPPNSPSATELPVRLTIFFLVLIIPLVIGAAVHIKKRNRPQTDQDSPGVELQVLT